MNRVIYNEKERAGIKDNERLAGFPGWLKQEMPSAESLSREREFADEGINTVCVEAKCPNRGKCFQARRVTFMILGAVCTRSCKFCSVDKSKKWPLYLENEEPEKIGRMVKKLGIVYAVVTSASRDDLEDGGARHFARTIQAIRKHCPETTIEVLIPDFRGKENALEILVKEQADVIGHNLETVRRLYSLLRPEADYGFSLDILKKLKQLDNKVITKSSLMLGLSETREEVIQAMNDLSRAGCDILVLGQYLAPSGSHEPVKEFISPEQFAAYREIALNLGFKAVLSEPLARSSYLAEEIFRVMRK